MPRPLPKPEELSEIQCGYYAAKEILAWDQPPYRHSVYMVDVFQCRRNCLDSISQFPKQLEFFCFHPGLCQGPVHALAGDRKLADPFEYLGVAVVLIDAPGAFVSVKRNIDLAGCLVIPVGFRFVAPWAAEHFCSVFTELECSHYRVNIFSGKSGGDKVNVLIRGKFGIAFAAVSAISDQFCLFSLRADLLDSNFAVEKLLCTLKIQ